MSQFSGAEADQNKVVSALTQVEAHSAICRLRRSKSLSPAQASTALDALDRNIERMTVQQVTPGVIQTANTITDRHHLRALDAIQLAAAIVARNFFAVPDMRFIASDQKLLEAARTEGFHVWDPASGAKGP